MPPLTDTEIKNAAIAIVDDEPANVLLVERTLSGAGYRTLHSTTDSRQALELIRQHHPALLLLDLNMPHLNGLQLMAQMAATLSDPPTVVVLTAQTALEHRLNVLQQGARDFISKPFEIPELLARVHNSLETHLLQARLRNDNILLEQRVAERTQELHDSRLEIIRRLGRAAEFRDNETGLHIIRMSKYSELLGRCAGMSDGEAELLLQASPMHDIGRWPSPGRGEARTMKVRNALVPGISSLVRARKAISPSALKARDESSYSKKLDRPKTPSMSSQWTRQASTPSATISANTASIAASSSSTRSGSHWNSTRTRQPR